MLKLFQFSAVRSPEPQPVTGVALRKHVVSRGLSGKSNVSFVTACENTNIGAKAIKVVAVTVNIVEIECWVKPPAKEDCRKSWDRVKVRKYPVQRQERYSISTLQCGGDHLPYGYKWLFSKST